MRITPIVAPGLDFGGAKTGAASIWRVCSPSEGGGGHDHRADRRPLRRWCAPGSTQQSLSPSSSNQWLGGAWCEKSRRYVAFKLSWGSSNWRAIRSSRPSLRQSSAQNFGSNAPTASQRPSAAWIDAVTRVTATSRPPRPRSGSWPVACQAASGTVSSDVTPAYMETSTCRPSPVLIASDKRQQNSGDRLHGTAHQIGNLDAWNHRQIQRQHAAQRHIVDIMPSQLRVRSVFAVARQADIDQPRVDGVQDFIAQSQPCHHARTISFDEDVCARASASKNSRPRGCFRSRQTLFLPLLISGETAGLIWRP